GLQEAEPAAAQEHRSARRARKADGRALSSLCARRRDGSDARRAQGSYRRRGDRGARPASGGPCAGREELRRGGIMSIETVAVRLGDRTYDILIGAGLVARAGEEIARRLPGIRVAIVTDTNVAAPHLAPLVASLDGGGVASTVITLPPGEKTKSFDALQQVVDGILAARLERGDAVIALGGGVIGDLAGFASGIVRRGMRFVQMPTSLLAQVDSSVGGKTGINSSHGKNLIGVFHQPQLVLADTEVLDTLPEREFRAGYAEIAKYGLIDRPDFFAWLET